jgi:hypothetical protein
MGNFHKLKNVYRKRKASGRKFLRKIEFFVKK